MLKNKQGERMKNMTVRIRYEDYELLRDTGAKYTLSMNAYVNRILRLGMRAEGILKEEKESA